MIRRGRREWTTSRQRRFRVLVVGRSRRRQRARRRSSSRSHRFDRDDHDGSYNSTSGGEHARLGPFDFDAQAEKYTAAFEAELLLAPEVAVTVVCGPAGRSGYIPLDMIDELGKRWGTVPFRRHVAMARVVDEPHQPVPPPAEPDDGAASWKPEAKTTTAERVLGGCARNLDRSGTVGNASSLVTERLSVLRRTRLC